MPSDAKKRKEEETGNTRLEAEGSGHPITEEEIEMETSEGVMVVEEREAVVEETTTLEVPDFEFKEMGIDYVETKMEDNGHLEEEPPPPAEVSSEVVVLQQLGPEASGAPLTEEEVEVAEAIAYNPLPEEEEKEEPHVSTVGEVQNRDIERSEIAAVTEVATAPLVGHRASLWNCCGLLDAFRGTQR